MEYVARQHFVAELHDPDDRQWSGFARLENDGISYRESRCNLAAGVNRWPVERDDGSDNSKRFQNGQRADGSGVVEVAGGDFVHDASKEAEHADQEFDIV